MKFQTKTTVIICIMTLMPMLIISAIMFFNYGEETKESVKQDMISYAQGSLNIVHNYLNIRIDRAASFIDINNLDDVLQTIDDDEYLMDSQKIMRNRIHSDKALASTILYDTTAIPILSDKTLYNTDDGNPSHILTGNYTKVHISEQIFDKNGDAFFSLSIPVYNDKNVIVGHMSDIISIKEIEEIIKAPSKIPTYFSLLSDDGNVIYSNTLGFFDDLPLYNRLIANINGSLELFEYSIDNKDAIAYINYYEPAGLFLVTHMSVDGFVGKYFINNKLFICLFIFMIIFLVALSVFVSRLLLSPFIKFVRAVELLDETGCAEKMEYTGSADLSKLKDTINKIIKKSMLDSKRLNEADNHIRVITRNSPGGYFRCANDEYRTFIHTSTGYLKLLGYTKDEINTKFKNKEAFVIGNTVDIKTLTNTAQGYFEYSYSIKHKDGSVRWIMANVRQVLDDNGNIEYFEGLAMDITNQKVDEEERLSTEKRYRLALVSENDIVMEIDITNNEFISGLEAWHSDEINSYADTSYDTMISRIAKSMVWNDDLEKFIETFDRANLAAAFNSGSEKIVLEFRRRNDTGYSWASCSMRFFKDHNKGSIIGISLIKDIDSEKRKKIEVDAENNRDTITGLHSHKFAFSIIEEHINEHNGESKAAIILLDIDAFKKFSSEHGQYISDVIIRESSYAIKDLFRAIDVIGRIGCDQFIIYLKNIQSTDIVISKVDILCKIFGETAKKHNINTELTATCGIAIFPDDGKIFRDVYDSANRALAYSKLNIKGGFSLYDDSMEHTVPYIKI